MKQSYANEINKLKQLIKDTKTIIIGAGAGLSTSAGYEYGGERYDENFADFKKKIRY